MKKISILVDQFYNHGGIEKLVSIKANYWAEKFGYDVEIVCTDQSNKPFIYKLSDKVKIRDLEINYNKNKSFFSIENIAKLLLNIIRIQKYIFVEKPDFILGASYIPIIYIMPFLMKGKAKFIQEFHFTRFFRFIQPSTLKIKILEYIEKKIEYLVILSNEEQSFYKSNNTIVIPNPIIKKQIKEEIFSIEKKDNIAITFVRFAPVKQLEQLIDIWYLFTIKQVNWKLHIYGDYNNDYGIKIKKMIQVKGLKNKVLLKGQTNNVYEKLNISKVLLMTSSQECFPMSILEAFSMGVPVISYDSPTGPRNIIDDNINGLLIPLNDKNKFLEKLLEFSYNKSLQKKMSLNALKKAKDFNLDKTMNKWQTNIFLK